MTGSERSRLDTWLRAHPAAMVLWWLFLVVAASVSLMLVGYAAPTLYEGF